MKPSPFVQRSLLGAVLVLGLVVLWWSQQGHSTTANSAAAHSTDAPLFVAQTESTGPQLENQRDLRLTETVWKIQTAADQAHLNDAIAAGLQVTGRIGPLGLVKVTGPLDLLRAWNRPTLEAGANIPFSLPRLPDSPALDGTRPFGAQLLDFFGLQNRSADWGRGVRIAVLDTGIADHPALSGAKMELSANVTDENGHGTAVASLIAGNDPHASGLAPAADLLIYKVLDANGQGDAFGIAEAIISATDRGAQIISLSAGSAQESSILRQAVDYAQAQGVVMVAAAGNEGADSLLYPAAYENVLGVGAVDANGTTASFSNSGPGLDLAAPGVGVHSAYSENRYIAFSGTSAAAPIVAGTIAALVSQDPLLSVAQASQLLLEYSSDAGLVGADRYTGAGILDPFRVIQRNDPNFSDLGVSAPYLQTDSKTGEGVSISINVQNRGNPYIANAIVQIAINGVTQTHRIAGLESKASERIVFAVAAEALESESGVTVAVQVEPGQGQSDKREENNGYTTVLQLDPGT